MQNLSFSATLAVLIQRLLLESSRWHTAELQLPFNELYRAQGPLFIAFKDIYPTLEDLSITDAPVRYVEDADDFCGVKWMITSFGFTPKLRKLSLDYTQFRRPPITSFTSHILFSWKQLEEFVCDPIDLRDELLMLMETTSLTSLVLHRHGCLQAARQGIGEIVSRIPKICLKNVRKLTVHSPYLLPALKLPNLEEAYLAGHPSSIEDLLDPFLSLISRSRSPLQFLSINGACSTTHTVLRRLPHTVTSLELRLGMGVNSRRDTLDAMQALVCTGYPGCILPRLRKLILECHFSDAMLMLPVIDIVKTRWNGGVLRSFKMVNLAQCKIDGVAREIVKASRESEKEGMDIVLQL
jgi:hypothetical protein